MCEGNTNSCDISQGIKNRDIGTLKIPNKMLSQYRNRRYPHAGDTYTLKDDMACAGVRTVLKLKHNYSLTQMLMKCKLQCIVFSPPLYT